MTTPGWHWPTAQIPSVTDGDTFDANVTTDIGFGGSTAFRVRLRLARINAPAKTTDAGKAAAAWLTGLLTGQTVDLVTLDAYKYGGPAYSPGEWMAEVTLPDGRNASDLAVSLGHAVYWNGQGPRPDGLAATDRSTVTDPARPQPVLDASKIGGLISAAVVAVGGAVFLIAGGISSNNLMSVGTAIGGAVTALIALAVYLVSLVQGHKAAAQVTPIAAPTAAGQPLLTADQWTALDTYGQHGGAELIQLTQEQIPTISSMSIPDAPTLPAPEHPTKKLGKLPPIPGRPAVPFGQFLTAAPAHPIADPAPNLSYPMDRNDVAGDCVVAGLDHTLQTICAALGVPRRNWTDAELLAFYRTQNPGFQSWVDGGKAADGGMIIQTFLEYLVAQGVILAFGKIDHTNPDEMRAAIYLGLAIVTGETLETAQQNQTVWDYRRSPDWGGHCTCTVGYATRQTCVSWGAEYDMTESFIAHQLDEAWFVLTQAHVDHPAFRAGYDLAGFAAAVSEMTGGKVVVPVPAPQPPAPGPAPTPGPGVIPADWVGKARHILTLKSESPAARALAQEVLAAAGPWPNALLKENS